jgi:dienelactone hydrolase
MFAPVMPLLRCATLFFLCSVTVHAAVVEEVVQIPVTVKNLQSQPERVTMTLTIFRDTARPKAPFVIINHGRAGSSVERARTDRYRYTENSQWFVSKGFAVFLPTRVGYGNTGGPDLEYSGRECARREFRPALDAAAEQIIQVVAYARARPYVGGSQGLIVGQSVGGAAVVAAAARNPDGVVAAINFSGGSGGDPAARPGQPCSPDALGTLYAEYGMVTKVPVLWLYSKNDRYWGPDVPKTWFKRYTSIGKSGEFIQLPPYGDDGHLSFTNNRAAWAAPVEQFMATLKLGMPH